MCQCVNKYKLQKSNKTLHPIPVPLKVRNQTGIDLIGPLKETDSYRYSVTAVDYKRKFVEAEPLRKKVVRLYQNFCTCYYS